jgi:hypothetical protein
MPNHPLNSPFLFLVEAVDKTNDGYWNNDNLLVTGISG